MPGKIKYKPGQRYGSRVIVAIDRSNSQRPIVHFVCDCGNEQKTSATSIPKSPKCRNCHQGGPERKYQQKAIEYPLYHAWSAMRRRCRSKNTTHGKYWGAKGISVCREWDESFIAFETWALANGYKEGLSIDRIDPRRNYEPSNCEWVTRKENGRRMRAAYGLIKLDAICSSGFLSFGA